MSAEKGDIVLQSCYENKCFPSIVLLFWKKKKERLEAGSPSYLIKPCQFTLQTRWSLPCMVCCSWARPLECHQAITQVLNSWSGQLSLKNGWLTATGHVFSFWGQEAPSSCHVPEPPGHLLALTCTLPAAQSPLLLFSNERGCWTSWNP